MKLTNQVIVVTGAGSGLGFATAALLAEQGAKIVAIDIDQQKAEQAAKAFSGLALQADVSDATSAELAIQQAKQHFGSIQGCINCAGVAPAARIVGKSGPQLLDDFAKVININLVGTFNLMRLCAAEMHQQQAVNDEGERGVIVNTASVAAFEGQVGQAAYSASKGGVVAMTLPAAREFAQFGVRVMTIAPGIMDTPMMASLPLSVRDSLGQAVTFPKRLGKAQEYAQMVQVIFENSYLNGSVIRLDGAIRMSAK